MFFCIHRLQEKPQIVKQTAGFFRACSQTMCCYILPTVLGSVIFDQKLVPSWAWRDNLVVKNTYHLFRGPRLGSQCPRHSSQLSVTPVPGNLMPLLTSPLRTPTCLWYTPIHPDTYKHGKASILKNQYHTIHHL